MDGDPTYEADFVLACAKTQTVDVGRWTMDDGRWTMDDRR